MRKLASLLLAAGLAFSAAPATAELCALDAVPAATLLLPHFAVDLTKLGNPARTETTTLVLLNASADDTIVRVTLWTDLGVPTLAFDLFLPSFDVEEIALHELFRGNIPADRVPSGINNALCGPDGLTATEDLRAAHTGRKVESYGGRCAGFAHGDRVARGYVTVDNVNRCDDIFPPDAGYFGSVGAAKRANQLTGQVRNDNRRLKYAEVEPLVHLEAASAVGGFTFYGRYVGYDGSDQREPLGIAWSAFYEQAGAASTTLEVWRDSGAVQGPFQCDQLGRRGWYPLAETQVVPFDQARDAVEICFGSTAEPVYCFPLESGAYPLGRGPLASPFERGWIYLNLNQPPDLIRQSYVSVRHNLGSPQRRARGQATLYYAACGQTPAGAATAIP